MNLEQFYRENHRIVFGYDNVSFRVLHWSDDSQCIWFAFEPEIGCSGAVLFDCEEKKICGIVEHEPLFELVE